MTQQQQLTQAILFVAAAQLTSAAMHTNATLPTDPANPVSDQQKAVDLGVWEVFRIFYVSGMMGVLGDPTDWPLPPAIQQNVGAGLSGPLAAPVQAIVKAVAGNQPPASILGLVQSLLTAVQGQQPTPPATGGSSGAPAGGTTQTGATATPPPVSASLPIK